jgi:hypothetical protein
MSKSYDNARELEYISFDSTNNKINFTVGISTNNAPVAASVNVYDANSSSNGAFSIPTGNTASRPANPQLGSLRYNTTLGYVEVYTLSDGMQQLVLYQQLLMLLLPVMVVILVHYLQYLEQDFNQMRR